MKYCCACKKSKSENEFYRRYSIYCSSYCKPCMIACSTAWRKSHPERMRELQKRFRDKPKNRVRQRLYFRKWCVTNRLRRSRSAVAMAAIKSWHLAHPDASAAHHKINNAIRDNKIVRPTLCSQCKVTGKVHAHHDDYKKPLAIRWLCAVCHKQHHERKRLTSSKRML